MKERNKRKKERMEKWGTLQGIKGEMVAQQVDLEQTSRICSWLSQIWLVTRVKLEEIEVLLKFGCCNRLKVVEMMVKGDKH
jgi:hypothetical protein